MGSTFAALYPKLHKYSDCYVAKAEERLSRIFVMACYSLEGSWHLGPGLNHFKETVQAPTVRMALFCTRHGTRGGELAICTEGL